MTKTQVSSVNSASSSQLRAQTPLGLLQDFLSSPQHALEDMRKAVTDTLTPKPTVSTAALLRQVYPIAFTLGGLPGSARPIGKPDAQGAIEWEVSWNNISVKTKKKGQLRSEQFKKNSPLYQQLVQAVRALPPGSTRSDLYKTPLVGGVFRELDRGLHTSQVEKMKEAAAQQPQRISPATLHDRSYVGINRSGDQLLVGKLPKKGWVVATPDSEGGTQIYPKAFAKKPTADQLKAIIAQKDIAFAWNKQGTRVAAELSAAPASVAAAKKANQKMNQPLWDFGIGFLREAVGGTIETLGRIAPYIPSGNGMVVPLSPTSPSLTQLNTISDKAGDAIAETSDRIVIAAGANPKSVPFKVGAVTAVVAPLVMGGVGGVKSLSKAVKISLDLKRAQAITQEIGNLSKLNAEISEISKGAKTFETWINTNTASIKIARSEENLSRIKAGKFYKKPPRIKSEGPIRKFIHNAAEDVAKPFKAEYAAQKMSRAAKASLKVKVDETNLYKRAVSQARHLSVKSLIETQDTFQDLSQFARKTPVGRGLRVTRVIASRNKSIRVVSNAGKMALRTTGAGVNWGKTVSEPYLNLPGKTLKYAGFPIIGGTGAGIGFGAATGRLRTGQFGPEPPATSFDKQVRLYHNAPSKTKVRYTGLFLGEAKGPAFIYVHGVMTQPSLFRAALLPGMPGNPLTAGSDGKQLSIRGNNTWITGLETEGFHVVLGPNIRASQTFTFLAGRSTFPQFDLQIKGGKKAGVNASIGLQAGPIIANTSTDIVFGAQKLTIGNLLTFGSVALGFGTKGFYFDPLPIDTYPYASGAWNSSYDPNHNDWSEAWKIYKNKRKSSVPVLPSKR